MLQIHQLRLQQELEFSQKQMNITKELTEKYQELQREVLEKDRLFLYLYLFSF